MGRPADKLVNRSVYRIFDFVPPVVLLLYCGTRTAGSDLQERETAENHLDARLWNIKHALAVYSICLLQLYKPFSFLRDTAKRGLLGIGTGFTQFETTPSPTNRRPTCPKRNAVGDLLHPKLFFFLSHFGTIASSCVILLVYPASPNRASSPALEPPSSSSSSSSNMTRPSQAIRATASERPKPRPIPCKDEL
ncbi:hypothetical protein LZ32DRAFT_128778 [Colletotrichum eremochloae]|nr:hypothetical protein LZ32DRAFT_128778 [Colletotrichum eremochloae]